MLNAIWVLLILVAIVCGALTGRMDMVTQQSMMSAKAAVMLAIGLVGIMAFWLGMVNIAREAGLLRVLARGLRPVMTRLFPDVPPDHPAMSAMIMNMASNMLGLGNAATPFGLKAMNELDRLNPQKGTATDAMALFLAINTSSVALLPTGVIAVRAAMGSNNPTGIIFTTLIATLFSTAMAIIAAKTFQRLPGYRFQPDLPTSTKGPASREADPTIASEEAESSDASNTIALPSEDQLGPTEFPPTPLWARVLQWMFWLSLLAAAGLHILRGWLHHISVQASYASFGWQGAIDYTLAPSLGAFDLSRDILSFWLLPALMAAILFYGISKGVKVYEALVSGAREGWDIAIRIIPYLVAILVAIGMFRASGAMDLLISWIAPVTQLIGMPAEALPMALMRPLSGSGAFGIMAETMQTHGPDSLVGYMVSTFQGSTETTFYVIAVYFGSVQVKNVRHTLATCLLADFVGILAAVWICLLMYG